MLPFFYPIVQEMINKMGVCPPAAFAGESRKRAAIIVLNDLPEHHGRPRTMNTNYRFIKDSGMVCCCRWPTKWQLIYCMKGVIEGIRKNNNNCYFLFFILLFLTKQNKVSTLHHFVHYITYSLSYWKLG